MSLTMVNYQDLDKARRRLEADREYHARARHAGRVKDPRKHHGQQKRFVGWDGEGPRDAGYALFGNSDGAEICHPNLSTLECLELLVQHKEENPNTINVWFGGDYDVSMILWQLPRRNMTALHEYNKTVWGEYRIEHIPHKWFKIRHGDIVVVLYDVHSFFDSGYYDALESWNIGTSEERAAIKRGKERRASFLWAEIDKIREYFRLELKLFRPICDKLRQMCADVGYVPGSWHGPGALARMALKKHGVHEAMRPTPREISEAVRDAYAGGRFELRWAGWIHGKVYNYDIHSAYPYFATMLPNLAKGKWRYSKKFESGKFGLYHIRYEAREPDSFRLYPLFRRMPNAGVAWPYRVTGWYWAPEAELVADDPEAKFVGGWIFDETDPTDRPFAWLAEYYRRRSVMKKAGQAAEYTLKLIINAVYGQLAQRVGWNRKTGEAPSTHQLEWAGFITSACRAAVYKAAASVGDQIISIDTDGIYAMCPVEGLDIGNELGQWERTEYDDGVFWQSGVYCLKQGNDWVKAKTRGIPKGTYSAEDLLQAIKTRKPLTIKKNKFIGYRQADNEQWSKRNTWVQDIPELAFGGGGKRQHLGRFGGCNIYCHDDLHALGAIQLTYAWGKADSVPHYLPWMDNSKEIAWIKEKCLFVFSEEDPDTEVLGWIKASQNPPSPNSQQPLRLVQHTNNASAAGSGSPTP